MNFGEYAFDDTQLVKFVENICRNVPANPITSFQQELLENAPDIRNIFQELKNKLNVFYPTEIFNKYSVISTPIDILLFFLTADKNDLLDKAVEILDNCLKWENKLVYKDLLNILKESSDGIPIAINVMLLGDKVDISYNYIKNDNIKNIKSDIDFDALNNFK